jgi:flavin reductase (DIM6/NTAB) family NADH-FMN oxidoreductase RutF
MESGRSRIVLGRVVAMYVEDQFVVPAQGNSGPYIKAEELHAVGRMNGLGNYVRTRDAFVTVPRISFAEWEQGKR